MSKNGKGLFHLLGSLLTMLLFIHFVIQWYGWCKEKPIRFVITILVMVLFHVYGYKIAEFTDFLDSLQ